MNVYIVELQHVYDGVVKVVVADNEAEALDLAYAGESRNYTRNQISVELCIPMEKGVAYERHWEMN